MSKKVNKKKNTRNNYKIEALEPRLMMDAAIDYTQFMSNYEQVDSLVETQLEQLQTPDLGELGIDNGIQSIKNVLNDLGSEAETALSSLYNELTVKLQSMSQEDGVVKNAGGDIVSVSEEALKGALNSLSVQNLSYEATQNGFKLTYSPDAKNVALPQGGLSTGDYISGVGASQKLETSAQLDIVFDMADSDNDGNIDSVVLNSVDVRDVNAVIEDVGGTAKFMNLSVTEIDDSITDLSLKYSSNTTSATSAVDLEFIVDTSNNDNFPFEFKDNGAIEIKKEYGENTSVVVPELVLKSGFEDFSLERALNVVSASFSTIPFIRDFEFGPKENKKKVVDYVSDLQKYWADTALAINGAVNAIENATNPGTYDYSLDLNNVRSFFDIILSDAKNGLSSYLEALKLEDASGQEIDFLVDTAAPFGPVGLSTTTPTSLYLTLNPKIDNIKDSLNFGLLKLSDLDVECSLKVKLDVLVDANDGTLIFDGFSLDKFKLTVSKADITDTISLGLFKADIVGGSFKLEASYDSSNEKGLVAEPVFSIESATLKSGVVEVAKLPKKEGEVYKFGYDALTENWIVPDEIKAFASLSGETLSHQVVAYLQSMQTALRKKIEDNVKMDFLGGSVGAVVDVIDKVDRVINGDGSPNGLIKFDKGTYSANFSSVEEFVYVFNEAWLREFGEADVCGLFVVDKNALTVDPVKLDVEKEGEVIVTKLKDSLATNFEFQNFVLKFNLSFTNVKDFDLNFAKSFGSDFANVATYGNVSVTCKAGINFELGVNFEHENLGDSTKLTDIIDDFSQNDFYYESDLCGDLVINPTRNDIELDSNKINDYAFIFNVDEQAVMVKAGTISDGSFVSVDKTGENQFVTSSSSDLPSFEYNGDIKKLIITNNSKFDVSRSGEADAFGDLKLVNTVLQTSLRTKFNSFDKINIVLKEAGKTSTVSITIEKDKVEGFALDLKTKGLSESSNWEDCLDKYLSLQKSDEDQFGLNSILSLPDQLEEGRSIKNTYGLYVVYVDASGEILFGCDPSLIKGYATERDADEIKVVSTYYEINDSNAEYMRVSGVLNASGTIGNQKGVLLENYSLNTSTAGVSYVSKYIDVSTFDACFNLESDATKASNEKTQLATAIENDSTFKGCFEAHLTSTKNQNGDTLYSIGVLPSNTNHSCWRIDNASGTLYLEKYQVVKKTLTLVDRIQLDTTIQPTYGTPENANDDLKKLKKELDALCKDAFDLNVNGTSIDITAKQTEISVASVSQSFLCVDVDGTAVYIDTENCTDLNDLARAVSDSLKANGIGGVKSVSAQNDKVVFTVDKSSTVTWAGTSLNLTSVGSEDFVVNSVPIDFADFSLSTSSSINDLWVAINNKLSGSGVTFEYTETDASGASVCLDHFEFRSDKEFSLKNVGASKVLEMFGFTAMKASECGKNDYRIIGKALLGIDWSKLINFADGSGVSFTADLTFEIGKDVLVGTTAPSLSLDKKTRTIVLSSPAEKNDFAEGGFIKNGDEYFRIASLNRNGDDKIVSIVISNEAVKTEDAITTVATWAANGTLKYVAAVDAAFAFVDANLIAQGSVHADVEFSASKKESTDSDFKDNDSFLSNWDFTISPPTLSGKFDVNGVVDALGKTVYLGNNTIELENKSGLPSVKANFNDLTGAISTAFADLSNFSMQDVYALLDGLVDRLTEIVKNSDKKIPVINKSVGDLVNVANDIRDIVSKLRSDNITSLQRLSDRLNKYLADFDLIVPKHIPQDLTNSIGNAARAFDIKVDGTDIVFNFNISKAFSTVHQFNFGGTNGGISGNADLKVDGDFWFGISAKLNVAGSFDFILNDSVKFGTNVNIVGEKLSFNLGIDGDPTKIDGFDSLLKNLITVGSDKASSFVVGKAALVGEFGKRGVSFVSWLDEDGKAADALPSFAIPMSLFGNLPISVCGYELGSIKFGKWLKGEGFAEVICADDINSLSTLLAEVSAYANGWFADHNAEAGGSVNIVAKKNSETTDFDFPEIKLLLKEDGKDGIDNGDLVVDISSVYDRIVSLIDGNLDWFDKIKLAVTGLNNLIDSLESSINSGMMSSIKDVPVVGNAMSGGVDFLSKLKQQILEPFSNFVYESTGMTAEMVAQKLSGLFGSYAILSGDKALLTKLSEANQWKKERDGVYYKQGSDFAEWFFTLGGDYSFGSDIGLDLGFPGLGLETDAGVNLSLKWKLNFGMRVSKDGGFEFLFSDKDDVQVSVNANMTGEVIGKMAGLGLKLDLNNANTIGSSNSAATGLKPGVDLSFGIDVDKSKEEDYAIAPKSVKLSEIMGSLPEFNSKASVNMLVGMTVGIVSDVKGSDAPKFPNIEGDFEFVWEDGEIKVLGFKDFKLDMGSFIGGVLGPIVSKIQKVVEPLKPLIDFLTTPFPVLDDLGIIMTPLSLAKEFSKGKFDDSMVYAIKDLIALSEKISAFGSNNSLKIDLGSMPLIRGVDPQGFNENADKLLKGSMPLKNLDIANYSILDTSFSTTTQSTLSGNGFQVGNGSWKFIWDEPKDIFKLLLGQDIDLVHYDMPKLSFDFDWDTFIRIWAPLGVRLGVSFNANIDLAFGYDTLGIRQWVGSDYKDFSRLLNGFYVDDLDDKGNDKSELSFYGGLTASAELNAGVSAGVGGGVGINVGFNLFDPNKDGKVRLNEIERIFKEEGLFGMFDVEGKITAKLYAYLDLLFYTKKWNITDDITLFEFNYEHTVKPIMISKSGDDVVANIGSNSSSRMSTDDDNKSLDDGDESLNITISGGNTISDGKGHSETIDGAKGKFLVNAENGSDKVIIASDDDEADFDIIINGGDGDDYIDLSGLTMKNGHVVYINGGAGVDTIIGAQGLNIIFGDSGVIRIDDEKDEQGNHKEYRFVAEAKVDANKAGGDIILGGSGSDIIFGGAGNDQIDGGKGSDYIFGDGGTWSSTVLDAAWNAISDDDKKNMTLEELALRVLQENEKLKANVLDRNSIHITHTEIGLDGGNDTLIGGDDDDEIHGGIGDDHIDGGAGKDIIYGEKGHDRILGGSGDDTIHGGEGMDIVFGDRVANSMDVAAPFAVDGANKTAAFSQEFIEAQFKDGNIVVSPNEFKIKLVDEDGNQLTPFVSELENKYQKNSNGEPDNNLIDNSLIQYSFDELSSRGNDTIYGEDGNDLLFGDDGSDTNVNGGTDKIYGGIGNDIIDGDGGNDTIEGGIDNDIIYGGLGDDSIDGGAGNDSLYGDNGVTDYDALPTDSTKKLTGNTNNVDKVVFGDNLGLHGAIYEGAESKTLGGNDKIVTGPGMDFVDGQGGSDKVTVKLMGESSVGYANVTDSGKDGADTLAVEGTEEQDELLMRMNKDHNLGFVALLPQDKEAPENKDKGLALNTNIERVNFTNSIETVNLNANGGDDHIVIDGTAKTTNVDGGDGADTIQVGQLYNSERVFTGGDKDPAKVQPVDAFDTVKTNEEKYLSEGVTKNTILNVEGNIGEDTFAALNNVGALNMVGGKGDDKFSIYGFQNEKDATIARGPVSIDGGSGNDSMFVRGTNGDDTVVLSKEGLLSNVVSVKAAGVETSTFDAAAGDDLFNVIGNNKGEVHSLNGGKGNDTFNMGSLDADYTLRGSSTEGQACDIKYEVFDASNKLLESTTESFTVMDTSNEPVVFVSSKADGIDTPELTIGEGQLQFFYLHFAGDKLNNQDISTITVNLTAPMLSEKALQSGAREIMLAQVPDSVSGDVSAFDPSWNWLSTLPVTLTTATKCVKIAVYCFADNLVEEESLKSISVSCECDGTALTKSVSSIALNVNKDNTSRSGDVNKLLAYAEEFNVSGNTVQLCDIAGGAGVEISAYVVGQQGIMTNGSGFSVDAASRVLTLDTPLTQAKLVVVYRSGTMRIDSSKAHLAYDDVDISKINVEYKADGANNFVNVNTLTDITWKRLGDTLVFYNASNKRMMSLHGELKITPKIATATDVFLPPEAGLAAAGSGAVIGKSNVVVEPHGTILAESGIFNSVELKVSYNGDFAGGAFVKVRISVMDAVNALDANGNYVVGKELEFVDAAGNPISSSNGEYVELTFTPENASVAQVVTLRAKSDTINEEYGYVTVHETEDERINGIEGAVYAFGMGASVDLDVDSPTMLSYAHKVEVVGAANAITHEEANKYNEKNDYDASKLLGFTQVKGNKLVISIASTNAVLDALGIKLNDEHSFEGKTIRFVANDSEGIKVAAESEDENDKYVHESVWFKIISCEAEGNKFTITLNEAVSLFDNGNSKVLFSSSKDYLFIDEDASVDRLFVNNKSDEEAKSSSLNAFAANSGILAEGELAEFGDSAETIRKNIQEAESAVDAYDRHAVRFEHDDIGKRGITAAQMEYAEYNLGTGKDTVDINKTLYREDAFRTYTVVNTGDAKDRDAAFGVSIGKAEISSDNLTNGANYIEASGAYKYDLIPADGSEISVIGDVTDVTVYVQAEIRKLNSESETGYDVVGIQRREVDGLFSSTEGFKVKYDFILAEGEYIGEFEFFQAEFDDYIRVNKYKADEASAGNVICSGVIAEVAPVQEETGDDNAETGDEPDTEGDGEATEGGEGAVEGDDEETTPAEEVAGFAYSYAMAESDVAEFENRMATFQAWQSGLTSAANGYVYGIFVDATMSDGSVQRRFVTELTANTFRISRDFTLSEGLSIVSLSFAYRFEGDGQLVVNAQAGHDRIDASSSDVTRNDMVAFGGFGDDYITMNKGGIAFGDRGQVRYENGQVNGKDVHETILGSTDGDGNRNGGLDYTTGIDKRAEEDTNEQPQYRLQTDGVNRDASEIRSMDDSNEQNGIDLINVGGTNSVVIGGDKADVIVIGGDKNVALGDNGRVLYNNAQNDNAVYGDKLGLGMHIVETTSDDIGDVDNIVIGGDKNVAMGGAKGDSIRITGADNVAIGDGGRYTIEETRLYAESKTDDIGGQDFISTGDGKNAVIGGTDKDWIYTGAGNDAIIGDGGKVIMDTDRNALMVTNEGRNIKQIDKDEQVSIIDDDSAGADHIEAGNGDNVVFGGLKDDDITTGNGQDVVFGDNAYATFRGNANEAFEQVGDRQNVPDVYEEATLSFNFQGASQTGLNAGDFVGAYNEENGDDYRSSNWNNISGSLAGTYGNDDREVVNMDNLDATGEKSADETRVRASGVSVSYGGIESHRNTSTDNRINLQAYNLGLWNAQYDKNAKLMNSGLMTTAPNAQCENKLDVQMDGLAQYFTSYRVVVYLDIPDSHSAADNSVRKVSLYTNDSEDPIKTFYVKDNAGHNFHGSYERSTAETAASAMEANYVVFTVDEGVAADRIRVVIEEADPNAQNGKNLPGIAAIQVRGTLHKQDVAATTDIDFGGNDTIRTDLGDDIVVGGTGSDDITTFGDERYGIHDNDVVFGDNAKILLTDRDSDESTASTISTAESVAITNIDAIYDDLIKTGNGNDTVVGGVGADTINAEATAAADTMLEDINVLSINFTREHSDSTDAIAQGEAAGVVVDTDWHNFYRNDRGVIVSESVRGQESSPEYNNKMNSLSNNPTASNPYAVEEGVEVQLYGKNHGQRQTVASFTIENYDELDGDTSNSKLFNTYLAAQQSEEIVLKLKNMNSFVSNSNNTVSSTYDLYIYLGGDNNDTDTYNYLYQVKFTGHNGVSQYRYLNDWTGHKFDGDYKEATCSSQTEAERMLQMALNESAHDSAAPRLELVGNYVVFRGVSGDVADIRIRNIYTSSGQHPKNLPMISAVQVVSGDGRYAGETDLGGDHDKDLVYGDDAKLVFDMDVPYDADVADVSKFKNRVIEAKSVAIEHDAVTSISTNDTITTGRDRDVAVGGEGADTITMGEGDDIALGGSANLVLEHNNPLGVFTPNTEIALDQHTIDTTQHQNYLDNDNANKWQFQSRLDQNHIQGIDTSVSNENDRKDTIDVGEGRNLTSQGSDSTAQLVVPKPVIVDDDGQEGSGEVSTPPVVAPDDGTVVIDQEGTSTLVEIAAGETVEIVITDWDEGNQYYHPNVFLQLNCSDNTRHKLSVTWDGQQTDPTVYLQNYAEFDIPDVATVVGEHKIVLRITSRDSISLMATVAHR